MGQDNTSSLKNPSTIKVVATEAVIGSDGSIKRKIPRLIEPVNDAESNLEASLLLSGAVNDQLTVNLQDTDPSTSQAHTIHNNRFGIYTAAALVVSGFLWSLYSIVFSNEGPEVKIEEEYVQYGGDSLETTIEGDSEAKMEHIANLIIQDRNWTRNRLELFNKHWNKLDFSNQERITSLAWFSHFKYRLNNEIKKSYRLGEFKDETDVSVNSPILSLALNLGILQSIAELKADKSSSSRFQDIIATSTDDKQLEKEVGKLASIAGISSSNKPMNQSSLSTKTSTTKDSTKNLKSTASVSKSSVVSQPLKAITGDDIAQVLNNYKSAYEQGDVNKLTSLFGVRNPNSGNEIVRKLKQNFENVINNSIQRTIDFKAINWRLNGPSATVGSDYKAEIKLKDSKGVQYIKGIANVELTRNKDQGLIISSFNVMKPKLNAFRPELNVGNAKINKSKRTNASGIAVNITAAELQDVVYRFVNAYENGDLEIIKNLFDKNARTNDRSGHDGITKDYSELFNKTSDRQMFIQNMKWKYENGYAKGIGDVQASIFGAQDDSLYSMEGKIQIVAKKEAGVVRITHLYHIEREK